LERAIKRENNVWRRVMERYKKEISEEIEGAPVSFKRVVYWRELH